MAYVLAPEQWGRGFMTELVEVMVAYCFEGPDIYRVDAVCDVENIGSSRVLEKAGLSFEGILRNYCHSPSLGPEPRDVRMYAALRRDFDAQ